MEVLFIMGVFGQWICMNTEGVVQVIDESVLDAFIARGRINKEDLAEISGDL